MKTEKNKPNLNTPLVSVTLGDFCKAMLTVWEHSGNTEMDETNFGPRKLLHGIKELASFLGFSGSTASRLHRSGAIRAATFKTQRCLIFDAEMVLDLLNVSKPKSRGLRGGYKRE